MSEVQLYLGDCLEFMRTLPAGSVDAIVTDPPYGIGYKSNRPSYRHGETRKPRSFGRDELDTSWLVEAYRALANHTCMYVFTRWDVSHIWKLAIEEVGFVVVQRLVWDKSHWGMGDLRYYGDQTEDVLFCRKGLPTMQYGDRRGNISKTASKAYYPEGVYNHPTQKPEALMRDYIFDSTAVGATVFDPFMGSGTTGVACMQTGRNFIGCEIDPGYFEIAKRRIEDAQQQPLLPFMTNGHEPKPTQSVLVLGE